MKTRWMFSSLLGILMLAACTPAAPAGITPVAASTTESIGSSVAEVTGEPTTSLDVTDPYGLTYVREEEKLARDVYLFLYDRWGLEVFQNIASSEQTHTEAVRNLLTLYGIPDPVSNLLPGQFTDTSLQALYDSLTEQGSLSLSDALKVGAAIEEIDILDLQARLEGSLPADVSQVYGNLLSGSYNHLGAFTSTLERQTGEVYTPQYMTPEEYQSTLILASAGGYGRGNGYQGGRP